jgi:hypothetical protein
MSQVQALVRVTGTAHGVRTVKIDAKPEVRDPETDQVKYEAKDASTFDEVGVAVRGRFGDTVTDTNTGTVAVLLTDDAPKDIKGGDEIDFYVVPYVRWTPGFRGGRAFPAVAYRFAGLVAPVAAAAVRRVS